METVQRVAKIYTMIEFRLLKVKMPSLRDTKYKGRTAYRDFRIDLDKHVKRVRELEEMYEKNCKRYGKKVFDSAVQTERYEIGSKYFGFNNPKPQVVNN